MNYSISAVVKFQKELKRLVKKFPSLKREYANLITSLKEDPQQGTPIGNSCYKIRLAISSKGKGKSGGARVITYVFVEGKMIYLLSIYDKSEKENIDENELLSILKSI